MNQDKAAEAREGLADNVAGKVKEMTGAVVGNDDLVEEGQLQQAEAQSRKEAAAYDAIADAERSEAAEKMRDSSREAQSKQEAAHAAAERDTADVQQQRQSEHTAADRDAAIREAHGDAVAQAHGDQVAENGQREAAAAADDADATEQQAQAESSRLEREAVDAAQDAERLRAQATSEGAS